MISFYNRSLAQLNHRRSGIEKKIKKIKDFRGTKEENSDIRSAVLIAREENTTDIVPLEFPTIELLDSVLPQELDLFIQISLHNDNTLSFGFAPKKVVKLFASFCSSYTTLSAAIEKLLENQERWKPSYKFSSGEPTSELFVKFPTNENVETLKGSIYKLYEFGAMRRHG